MNLLGAIGVYGALLKARGEPLHFPGSRTSMSQPTDTDLIAQAIEWAGHAESARNQIFNIDNGELHALADQWPVIADALGMAVGDDVDFSFLNALPGQAGDWDAIRAQHDLIAPRHGRIPGPIDAVCRMDFRAQRNDVAGHDLDDQATPGRVRRDALFG